MGMEFFGMSKTTYPTTENYVPRKLKEEHLCHNPKYRNHFPFLSIHEYKLLVLPKTLE